MNLLRESLLKELEKEPMLETIGRFASLYRYSGTPQGEEACRYIEDRLREYGVSFEHCEYDGFFSLPVKASLDAGSLHCTLVGDVYSTEAKDLSAELIFDEASERKSVTPLEQEARFAAFRDKIVLTWDGRGPFAARARRAGAKGILHICRTKGNYNHHSNIGVVWGTPDLDEARAMDFMPSAGILRADGEALIERLKQGPLTATLNIEMDTDIRRSSMTVAEIPGQTDSFVLVSAHYDSWYEGITDNAAADAILLEYARVLQLHQKELKRGVRIAWWSGHSDGRFSGSTWYCDSHRRELSSRCVAHVNLDLCGCKNSEQIVARTLCTEGMAYTSDLIEKYTGRRPEGYTPMIRGADQSFFGTDIPITIMLKYEPVPEKRLSDCPSGGPWWHTPEDRLDKLDETFLMRDARINMEMIEDLTDCDVLPLAVSEIASDLDARLSAVLKRFADDGELSALKDAWARTRRAMDVFAQAVSEGRVTDSDAKRVIGRLAHTVYCHGDRYHQDTGEAYGIWADLSRCAGVTENGSPKSLVVMAKTELMRTQNRLCDELEGICRAVEARFGAKS